MTIGVVIGTIGRPTLELTLDSIACQLQPGDQVIVVRDSFEDPADTPRVRARVEAYGAQFVYSEFDAGYHYYSAAQANHGFSLVTTDVVLSMGDDDVYVPHAFERLRHVMASDPQRPVIFQFLAPWREILWDKPRMLVSHVSGQCMAVPRQWLGPFSTERYLEADYDWMVGILARAQTPPLWLSEVLVIARPDLIDGKLPTGVTPCKGCDVGVYTEHISSDGLCYACVRARRLTNVSHIQAVKPAMHLRVMLVHPGADVSVSDVFDGMHHGLKQHGVTVFPYWLNKRMNVVKAAMFAGWRRNKKASGADIPQPTNEQVQREASLPLVAMALQHDVHVVIVVSAFYLHPDALILLRRAKVKVVVLFTESPYNIHHELKIAELADGCWTNERASLPAFLRVNANSGYLPHGWHPERHGVELLTHEDVPAHDVVFVGSGFQERIEWFNAIDWSGIDLALYGTWKGYGLKRQVLRAIRGESVGNERAAALYRRSKVGLNLYRSHGVAADGQRVEAYGESLSPRAYELAQCGVFHVSDFRPEVAEVFGELVPTFRTPTEAAALIRSWLADDAGRADVAAQLPACVAEASWVQRASTVLGDLHQLLRAAAA